MSPFDIDHFPKGFQYGQGQYDRAAFHPSRPGIVVYETRGGQTLEATLCEVMYRTRSFCLANSVGNQALTDIRIGRTAVGAIRYADIEPRDAHARPEVGEIWLVCDLSSEEDDTWTAGGAARQASSGHQPTLTQPSTGPLNGAAQPAPRADHERYQGIVVRILPQGYGFIGSSVPALPRDPYVHQNEVQKMKALGCDVGSRVTFKVEKYVHNGEVRLRAIDVRPI